MKKILSILLMLLMVMSMASLAFAEEEAEQEPEVAEPEEEEVDAETEEEVEAMSTGKGAEVRLLQLEKAITKNILKGNEIINTAKEDEKDTADLEAILAELETLKTEVQEAEPVSEDAVKMFVDLKSDAIELSKQFRDTARALLKEEKAAQLRTRLKEFKKEELTKIAQRVQVRIRAFNSEQLQNTFEVMKIENDELIEKVEAGEAALEEAKTLIRERVAEMTTERKKETFKELKEEGIKRRVVRKAAVANAKVNILVRKEERLTNRLEKVEDVEDEEKQARMQKRINNRLTVINARQEKIAEKTGAIEAKAQERIQQRIATSNSIGIIKTPKAGEEGAPTIAEAETFEITRGGDGDTTGTGKEQASSGSGGGGFGSFQTSQTESTERSGDEK